MMSEDRAFSRSKVRQVGEARAKLAEQHASSAKGVPGYEGRMARLAAVRRRETAAERSWCILRTNSRRTLTLAQSLNDAGIEAWTPRVTRKHRLPRRQGIKEVVEPIVPSFVFARSTHLPDLLRVLALPSNPHPPFSIFQHAGRAPIISDGEIANLQRVEDDGRRAMLKAQRHDVAVGTKFNPTEGAFAGLNGVVEEVKGKLAQVRFNDGFIVKIATWLLVADHVENMSSFPPTGSAAGHQRKAGRLAVRMAAA